jgi:hypothetical protein
MEIKVNNIQLDTNELIRLGNMENLNATREKMEKIILGSSEQLFRNFEASLIKTGAYIVEEILKKNNEKFLTFETKVRDHYQQF